MFKVIGPSVKRPHASIQRKFLLSLILIFLGPAVFGLFIGRTPSIIALLPSIAQYTAFAGFVLYFSLDKQNEFYQNTYIRLFANYCMAYMQASMYSIWCYEIMSQSQNDDGLIIRWPFAAIMFIGTVNLAGHALLETADIYLNDKKTIGELNLTGVKQWFMIGPVFGLATILFASDPVMGKYAHVGINMAFYAFKSKTFFPPVAADKK